MTMLLLCFSRWIELLPWNACLGFKIRFGTPNVVRSIIKNGSRKFHFTLGRIGLVHSVKYMNSFLRITRNICSRILEVVRWIERARHCSSLDIFLESIVLLHGMHAACCGFFCLGPVRVPNSHSSHYSIARAITTIRTYGNGMLLMNAASGSNFHAKLSMCQAIFNFPNVQRPELLNDCDTRRAKTWKSRGFVRSALGRETS